MGFNVVYSDKDKIESSIAQGVIPKESLILSNEQEGISEASYYDDQGNLKTISRKNTFNSMVEANLWTSKYDCKGQLIAVQVDGNWTPCVIDANNKIVPMISEQSTIIFHGGNAGTLDK